jgi:conjugative transposon protein TcpC
VEQTWIGVRRARIAARAPRYLVLVTVVVLALLGLRDLVRPPHTGSPPRAGARVDRPSEDFALQFVRAYLTYDATRPGARERALAPFLPEGFDPDAGFAPTSGSQAVEWAEVASDQPSVAGGRLITVAAQASSQTQPLYLAVGVRHHRAGGLELTGYPAFVGAPSIDRRESLPDRQPVADQAVSEVVTRVIRNYLAGAAADLAADLTPDARVTLPTLPLSLSGTDQLLWTDGPGSGAVLVTVEASDQTGATHRLTYELGIRLRERPYVDFVELIPTGS